MLKGKNDDTSWLQTFDALAWCGDREAEPEPEPDGETTSDDDVLDETRED